MGYSSARLFALWSGLAGLTGAGCGSQWSPRAQLADVSCGSGRCFDVDADDRLVGFGPLVDACGHGLIVRQAALMGMGDRIVLSGRMTDLTSDGTSPSLDGCVEAASEQFVANLDLSAGSGVTLVERDPIAEELGVAGHAARVMAEGSYVVFAGDSNRTEKILRQPGDGWQATAVEVAGASATDESPAPTAQALPLSDGRTMVVRPPGAQGRRLRLETLTTSAGLATTLWPLSEEGASPKLEGDLRRDAWSLRAFDCGAAQRLLLFGGNGKPIWFSTTKPGFAAEASAAVSGVGTAWQASSIVPLPHFQAGHGYPSGSLLVVGGTADDAAAEDVTEARLQVFDPAGNRWLSPAIPLPFPLLHTSPVLLPDGTIALIGGRRPQGSGPDRVDTQVIYLAPDLLPDPASEPGLDSPPTFSVTVGRARPSRVRGQGTSALLLPSGAVFIAGGQVVDGDETTENADFEVLEPPYLAEGRQRPLIQGAPASLKFSDSFAIEVAPSSSGLAAVVLMAFGAVTSGRNVPQRYVELALEDMSPDGRHVVVRAPDTPLSAPPGRYLLFVVDSARVPSAGIPVALGDDGGNAP